MRIRKAEVNDSKSIAKVNIDVWRTTYRGIMPDGDLDNLSYHDREKFFSILWSSDKLKLPFLLRVFQAIEGKKIYCYRELNLYVA